MLVGRERTFVRGAIDSYKSVVRRALPIPVLIIDKLHNQIEKSTDFEKSNEFVVQEPEECRAANGLAVSSISC